MTEKDRELKCGEKACPFFAQKGHRLCRFHRQTYTYGVSLEGDGNPINDQIDDKGIVAGFTVQARKRVFTESETALNRHASQINVQTQIIGSGRIIKGSLDVLSMASNPQRKHLFSRLEAAQELFKGVRYPEHPFCTICGCEDLYSGYHSGGRMGWRCKRCGYSFSLMSQTFFSESKISAHEWLNAIWELDQNAGEGAIANVQRILCVTQKSAAYINRRVRLAGMSAGIEIGHSRKDWRAMMERRSRICQGRSEQRQCGICQNPIVVGQGYRYTKIRAAHEECLSGQLSNPTQLYIPERQNGTAQGWQRLYQKW